MNIIENTILDDRDLVKARDIQWMAPYILDSFRTTASLYQHWLKNFQSLWTEGRLDQIERAMCNNVFGFAIGVISVEHDATMNSDDESAAFDMTFDASGNLEEAKILFPGPQVLKYSIYGFYEHVFRLSHELAHIRMVQDEHVCRLSEVATDMVALMVMGSPARHCKLAGRDVQFGYIRPDLCDAVYQALELQKEPGYV